MIIRNKMKNLILAAVLLLIILSFSLPVLAHKVILYAYVEADQIIAEGAFGDGSAVKNAEISVYNKEGELLAQGKTDQNGICEIPIPAKTDLELKMNAGMGHQAQYSIAEGELPKIIHTANNESSNNEANGEKNNENEIDNKSNDYNEKNLKEIAKEVGEEKSTQLSNNISEEKLRKIIAEELEQKLAPIKKSLRQVNRDQGPGVTEIIGGIGYIFGLMGIALYFKSGKND